MSRFSALLSLLSLAAAVSAAVVVGRDPLVPVGYAGPDGYNYSPPSKRDVSLEKRGTYTEVFDGTGTDPSDRDASIQGQGYLTFTRLDSYDLGACEAWCDNIDACAFINLFDEYNSDATYNPQHKCVAYAYPQDASEKTNFGGQQLLPLPTGTTYIQNSVGYTSDAFESPPTPDGYVYVFGPTNGANEAPNFLEDHSLSFYDTIGCAQLCTDAAPNPDGFICTYFNIWLGVQNGNPTFNCALYGTPTDESTATNQGSGGIQVTNSRGYARILATGNLLTGGDFEDYLACDTFCYTTAEGNWVGTSGDDANIFYFPYYARTGHGVAILGSALGYDSFPGTLSYTPALDTIPGQTYLISFWQESTYSGGSAEGPSFVQVLWNGATVLYITPGYQDWTQYTVQVTAVGNDHLAFRGGSYPAYNFLDDISVTLVL